MFSVAMRGGSVGCLVSHQRGSVGSLLSNERAVWDV